LKSEKKHKIRILENCQYPMRFWSRSFYWPDVLPVAQLTASQRNYIHSVNSWVSHTGLKQWAFGLALIWWLPERKVAMNIPVAWNWIDIRCSKIY